MSHRRCCSPRNPRQRDDLIAGLLNDLHLFHGRTSTLPLNFKDLVLTLQVLNHSPGLDNLAAWAHSCLSFGVPGVCFSFFFFWSLKSSSSICTLGAKVKQGFISQAPVPFGLSRYHGHPLPPFFFAFVKHVCKSYPSA